MVEPGSAADDTSALHGGETAAVPNPTPTDAVEVAWSRDDGRDFPAEPVAAPESWRSTMGRAAALLLVGLGLAGAIIAGHWALTRSPTPTEAAPPPVGPTASATSSASAATISSTPDQDGQYIQALNDRGISVANPEAAIHNGKVVCQNIRQGMTVAQVVAEFRASNPALSDDATAYVDISIRAYCP
ncbi:DUF732 domain-containing protein [Mycobacterium shinjukuense]|uniref:DUF732 domain-containing protein n=1 Tax=Mycobacterium shinjukuense TaxID=398694 RepID=A0A7I7MQA8_9MYCO|nr:DUF732 domain-containing protein [Mycobacterium shinjukuense]MCV6985602.1 DUF732 domain-containing protein [Mycobacterium shinjukuense]ORB71503.1 hypothetical protein BST45_02390 [Mycobacterium shinjukuense]BBX74415.1 hypothetical protein MSHI_23210 [Mycobacterium shinjukuense]